MKYTMWIGILATIFLMIGCCITWVYIPSKNIAISGFYAAGTNFGKPGLLHFILSIFILVACILPKIWIKRTNIFLCAVNLAFAIRNYILITSCFAGECPEKKIGIFLVLISSSILMLVALFPNISLKNE